MSAKAQRKKPVRSQEEIEVPQSKPRFEINIRGVEPKTLMIKQENSLVFFLKEYKENTIPKIFSAQAIQDEPTSPSSYSNVF